MTLRKRLMTLAFFLSMIPISAGRIQAQSTTQGAIGGTVFDTTGAIISGASITIRNDATNAEFHLTADGSGYFKAPLLEPGVYTVIVTAASFGQYTASKVEVQVGQLTTIEPHMATGEAAQTVDVSADAATLNLDSPDLSAVLDRKAVDDIPVQNRRWSALALTTPGVVADSSGFGLISVRGLSTLLNNVEIDGADDNQAYFSEERGRTREGYSTSSNQVQEFEVNTGVYSAQYGRAAGGVINSVTRSGGNKLHGELFFTDLDKGFGAFDPGSISPAGTPLKPKDLRKIYGGSVGGAIIKDKLFWFYTYDQLTHINPGISKAASYGNANGQTTNSFLEQPDPTVTSCSASASGAVTVTGSTTTHSALDAQVCAFALRQGLSYADGAVAYNAGVQSLTTDLGTVPRAGYQEINTPKLDWQINAKNRASFLFHRLRWDAPGDVQTSSSASYSVDAFGEDFVKLDYGIAKLESQITSKISNELLYQYSRELNDEGQQPYSAYTLSNLVAAGGSVSGAVANGPGGTIPYINLDTSIGFNLGSPYYSYRLAYPDERKWQIEDVLYYSLGNHSIRVGGDFVHNADLIHQTPYYYGDYTYSSIPNFLSDIASKGKPGTCNANGSGVATATAAYGCYSSVFQDYGTATFSLQTTDYAGFVQDNWKVRPRLTLELGLRYDYESLPAPPASLTTATGSFVPYAGLTNAPSDKNNFGPRAGFSYDVFGTGNTVLRGGYGLYYGRILNGTIATAQFGSGSPNGQFAIPTTKPTAAGAPTFPFPVAAGGGVKPSSFFLAPNLQNPQVHEIDLQVQQQVGKGTIFQVSYIGALGRELPNFLDVNLAPPTFNSTITIGTPTGGTSTGPLAPGSTYSVPTFTGYINPNFGNITEVISNINSSYHGLTAEIQNRSIHGFQFDANYTWSHALDYNQNASSTTSTNNWLNPYASARQNYGTSQFNVGNRFVGYVLYTFPNISGGGALKYLTNGWSLNDTFQMQNGLPYSATIGRNFNSTEALNSSWNGAPSVFYLPPIGLNTYQVPKATVDDVRLQKAFTLGDRYQLQLNADMYNVANHQNFSTSDISTTAYNFSSSSTATGNTLTYVPQTAPNVGFQSHITSNDSGFLYTPREFQIGARLEF